MASNGRDLGELLNGLATQRFCHRYIPQERIYLTERGALSHRSLGPSSGCRNEKPRLKKVTRTLNINPRNGPHVYGLCPCQKPSPRSAAPCRLLPVRRSASRPVDAHVRAGYCHPTLGGPSHCIRPVLPLPCFFMLILMTCNTN